MCRIDAAFADLYLDEKATPLERFKQCIDEFSTDSKLTNLLTKHFSENWQEVLGDIQNIEKALEAARSVDNSHEKLVAFLKSSPLHLKLSKSVVSFLQAPELHSDSPLIKFVKDATLQIYGSSLFSVYESKLGRDLGFGTIALLQLVYGENFFNEGFFNDPTIIQAEPDVRVKKLWGFFCEMVRSTEHLSRFPSDQLKLSENDLIGIIGFYFHQGAASNQTAKYLKGVDYLNSWIRHDAVSGIWQNSFQFIFYEIDLMFYDFGELLAKSNDPLLEKKFHDWKTEQNKELKLEPYTSVELSNSSDTIKSLWAAGIEQHFETYCSYYFELKQVTWRETNEITLQKQRSYLDEIVTKLSPFQLEVWIKQNIIKDFETVFASQKENGVTYFKYQNKWCYGRTYDVWKTVFLSTLQDLNAEQQLKVFSVNCPFPELPKNVNEDEAYAFYREQKQWWQGLFSRLLEHENLSKSLLPSWTIIAKKSFGIENLLPNIDKSIGILRGELNKPENTEDQTTLFQKQLIDLFKWLDEQDRHKAIKHRMMLLRTSQYPFADECMNYRKNHKDILWYKPLIELSKDFFHFEHRCNPSRHLIKALEDFYSNFSKQIAEYCLSRLRLRKGEKAKDGFYDSSQSIESSAIWRQGYLKALSEIGFDLNGQVHKTVNFVKQYDPHQDVRDIAKEAYKVVRRDSSPAQTIEDFKRGIIAAEWWLLLCQRQELQLPINYEEALKTRRRLLRNP